MGYASVLKKELGIAWWVTLRFVAASGEGISLASLNEAVSYFQARMARRRKAILFLSETFTVDEGRLKSQVLQKLRGQPAARCLWSAWIDEAGQNCTIRAAGVQALQSNRLASLAMAGNSHAEAMKVEHDAVIDHLRKSGGAWLEADFCSELSLAGLPGGCYSWGCLAERSERAWPWFEQDMEAGPADLSTVMTWQ